MRHNPSPQPPPLEREGGQALRRSTSPLPSQGRGAGGGRSFLPLFALLACAAPVAAQPNLVAPDAVYTYDQRLSARVPGGLTFADEDGRAVRLGDLLASQKR